MFANIRGSGRALIVLALVAFLGGCGGTKVLREPQPLASQAPLAVASDTRVSASLDWVIVRDGPGTWAKNADWDEYLVSVRNATGDAITITSITVTDSGEHRHDSIANRRKLVKASRKTGRRYKDEGIKYSEPEKVISGSCTRGNEQLAGKKAKLRPWLQGFDYKVRNFGPDYVVTQIRASDEAGCPEWYIWNAKCDYSVTWQAMKKLQAEQKEGQ